MKIGKEIVASIDYTLKNDEGTVLDTSEGGEPLSYLHGAGNIIPGLEKELSGREAGDTFTATIDPIDGYGEYADDLVFSVTKDQFDNSEDVKEGLLFQAEISGEARLCTVSKIDGEKVEVDANHPLSGMTLHFEITVCGVREATAEEIEHGHVHDGHHHH